MRAKKRYIVIGGGIAGVSAAEAIHEVDSEGEIHLICKEAELPYFRMNLTRYMAGEIDESKLPLHPKAWYENKDIVLHLGQTVSGIDSKNKAVSLEDGKTLSYDQLILANGASPFIPPFEGSNLTGVMAVRTHEDVDKILQACQKPINVVCIGGGLLGLENAGAIARRGEKVTVIETFDWLLPRQLPKEGGKKLQEIIEGMGINVITGAKVKGMRGSKRVEAVELENHSDIRADLVLITAGISANLELAKKAGLEVSKGIIVNDQMQTSEPEIYAAGDNTEHHGRLYGLWMPSKAQGTVAGHNAAGRAEAFKPILSSSKLKVLGVDLFSIGQVVPVADEETLVAEVRKDSFLGFVIRGGVIIGASFLGDTSLAEQAKLAIDSKSKLPTLKEGNLEVAAIQKALQA